MMAGYTAKLNPIYEHCGGRGRVKPCHETMRRGYDQPSNSQGQSVYLKGRCRLAGL